MTVRCLRHNQKILIAHQYSFLKLPIQDIAHEHEVSTRTIERVLDELKVDRPVKRRAKVVIKLEPVQQLSVQEIDAIPLTTLETVSIIFKAFVVRPLLKPFHGKPRS